MFAVRKPEASSTEKQIVNRALRYYEKDGAVRAYANKATILAFISGAIALGSLGLAAAVRLQPPTVIRIQPNGESSVLGERTPTGKPTAAVAGADDFLNQAYLKRFLSNYLNYAPANVDDHWSQSMNMMTYQLRAASLKAMQDGDLRGKIDTDQISSVFHLRMISPVAGDPLSYQVYGVKDVHRINAGSETTDHFVNEYKIRLAADHRTDVNPDGLWVADYQELPIDGERRNEILSAPDHQLGE